MKPQKITFLLMIVIGMLALFAGSVMGADIMTGAGVSLAFAGVVGTPVTDTVTVQNVSEANENILPDFVVKEITKIRPSATPLDTIIQTMAGKKTCDSFTVRYYSSGVRDIATTVKTQVEATTSSNSQKGKVHEIQLENLQFVDENDVIMFHGVKDGTEDGMDLLMHVLSRNPVDGKIQAIAINGTGTNAADVPQINVGTGVSRVGNAMNERDARCNDHSIVPEDEFNYCQIIMSTLSQGTYEKMVRKEVDFDINFLKDQSLYDFRRKREAAMLFGKKARIINTVTGKDYYHTQGIARTIYKNKVHKFNASDKAKDQIVDWSDFIFNGNNGSDQRIMIAGPGILNWMGKSVEVSKWLDGKATEVVQGIRFNKIETQYGVLLVKFHHDFVNHGWGNRALVIDTDYIDVYNLKKMGVRTIDNEKVGTELSQTYVLEEALCPVVTNLDCHAVLELDPEA